MHEMDPKPDKVGKGCASLVGGLLLLVGKISSGLALNAAMQNRPPEEVGIYTVFAFSMIPGAYILYEAWRNRRGSGSSNK